MLLAFIGLLLANGSAHAALTWDQVVKQFHEPGHMPQGLKPRMYHPLHVVISKEKQVKMKALKHQKRHSQKAETPIELPQSIDLRSFDSPIRNQWDGTCTAHGMIETMENQINRDHPKSFLSTRYFWSQYEQYDAGVAIQSASQNLQIDNTYWPQDSAIAVMKNLDQYGKYQLTDYDDLQSDTDLVIKALAQKFPVYIAMQVPSDMASCRSTIRYTTSLVDGGHALSVVGYQMNDSVQGGGYFIIKNSWGTDCGDEGYQYLPIGLCDRDDMYCLFWSVKKVTVK